MDIYEFFNSRDIAEHCRKIGHVFTSTEMAYLVWRSNHHTLNEKHEAWQEIIDTMPDDPFFEDYCMPLHDFLRVHMKMQNKYIRSFRSAKKNHVFSFSLTGSSETDKVFWETYDACLDAANAWLAEYADDDGVTITKHLVQSGKISRWSDETIHLNRDLAVMDIEPAEKDYDPDDERFYLNGEPMFQEMKISIPAPFQKGDIVVNAYHTGRGDRTPFVLGGATISTLEHMECGGAEYMYRLMDGWFDDEVGSVYMNLGCDFLDLEYAQIQPEFHKCFLYAMSRYLKGKISLSQLLEDHSWALLRMVKSHAEAVNDSDEEELPF